MILNAWFWIGLIVTIFVVILMVETRAEVRETNQKVEEIRSLLQAMSQQHPGSSDSMPLSDEARDEMNKG